MTLLCSFLVTPFLGKKIAYDEEFRKKYIPEWYDYTIEKPKSAWTKEELHEQVMLLRTQLHERAIAGEFTPEKLEEMRRNLQKKPDMRLLFKKKKGCDSLIWRHCLMYAETSF